MRNMVVAFIASILLFSTVIFSFPSHGYVEVLSEKTELKEVPENTLRIHYQSKDQDYTNLGIWTWEDVVSPTDNWPSGGIPFDQKQSTDFGVYVDVPIEDNAKKVGFLVLDRVTGDKEGDDKIVEFFSPNINQVWITEGSDEVHLFEPVNLPANTVRIHYKKADKNYDNLGLWLWDDVAVESGEQGDWPKAATPFTAEQVGPYGAYIDVQVKEGAQTVSFLVVNRETGEQSEEMSLTGLNDSKQLFTSEGDIGVYTNPYGAIATTLQSGEVLTDKKMTLTFSKTAGLNEEELLESITVVDKEQKEIAVNGIKILDEKKVELSGDFPYERAPFYITFGEQTVSAVTGWRMMDEMYGYEGELGASLHQDGTATLKIWSPKAESVSVILYDKDNQFTIVADEVEMTLGDHGVWQIDLDEANTGVKDLRNYYYHYAIEHDGEKVLALDPYAKSMAGWSNQGKDKIGKAAIVDPSSIGPKLNFANIDGFKKREDAIIYEVHVRDFTSDPNISDQLTAQFGTFAAFVEKLDYIEELGVTHIQLLPVLSYYFGDEFASAERMLEYASTGTNYNWGYDPQSYFSLTGMYSENPNNPELRIAEFKKIIDEIHRRGMGVVLDVVYNHTAQLEIFENLVPNYYHFMEQDGTPKTSFGGGRLGTTHQMARRILVDSITYLVEEYKVDGFRFDMMGDHDSESIQIAFDEAKKLNPNIIMIGEGWVTYEGDSDDKDVMPADQQWMQYTESVASFSDEFRNELKSGFGSEGQPMFLTGGARSITQIFNNIKAQPHNFVADDPGDVVPYIAAHDNLTLHDVIAQSIKKDPEHHEQEIHERIRIGNAMVLTSQGTAFLHAGQEFGRTKQFRAETNEAPYKSTYMVDEEGKQFTYPYFIHDSYDSTDIINRIDWEKATNEELYPINNQTRKYTQGLIKLRRSTDAFRLGTKDLVDGNVTLLNIPEMDEHDLVIGYRNEATNGDAYYVFINSDMEKRTLTLNEDLTDGVVIVDKDEAGTERVSKRSGFELTAENLTLEPLTTVVIKVAVEGPTEPEAPEGEEPEKDWQKEIKEIEKQLAGLKQQIETLKDLGQIPALEKQLAELKQQIAGLLEEVKQGKEISKLQELEKQLEQLSQDLAEMKEKLQEETAPGGDNSNHNQGNKSEHNANKNNGNPAQDKKGKHSLPNTATQMYNYLLIGIGMIIIGGLLYIRKKRKA